MASDLEATQTPSGSFARTRIHNWWRALTTIGPFYVLIIDPNTGEAIAERDEQNEIKPSFIAANPVSGSFDVGRRKDRYRREIVAETWEFKLGFPVPVITEVFEQKLLAGGLVIPPGNGVPALFLDLESYERTEPPEQDADNGTWLTYTFQVRPGS